MAVGFGAIRRPLSEDLIVSCYYLIRKYDVINTIVIFLYGAREGCEDKHVDVEAFFPVAVGQFPCRARDMRPQLSVRTYHLSHMGGSVGTCERRCLNYMELNIIVIVM
jgi:hypothetical protein